MVHTHTRSHAHTHVWNAMEAHFFLNICFRASLLLCSFCFFLLLCLLCFLFSASLLLCFSAFPCFFFGGGFSSLNYIYMYNPKKHVVNKPEANPKSTPKSQLGRTYILSLLFHTVNVYCDYLYMYIGSSHRVRLLCWCFLHVRCIPQQNSQRQFWSR